MIKQAYFRGLIKIAQKNTNKAQQQDPDRQLLGGNPDTYAEALKDHGFYKGTPVAAELNGPLRDTYPRSLTPAFIRRLQAGASAIEFAPGQYDPNQRKLRQYYENIGRQNRDFYLKQGFRPPKDHKYKTEFPFQNHPKKKQMMLQNPKQVRNNTGRNYSDHA